jgi:nucleobase:cation symporter-1, NCS1 family
MSSFAPRADVAREPGIRPVPVELRTLSGFDLAILWGDLGIGLLVLVTGALLVPGLGFPTAMVAVVLGSIIGVALLALAGVAGADHGLPAMVLFRSSLGVRGSWVPSVIQVLQMVGWTAVELWAMSYVADLVIERLFGFSARPLWLVLAALLCTTLALWGPVGVTRVWMERFGAWLILGIVALVSVMVLVQGGLTSALRTPAAGGFPTFGAALDLVIAMPVSWLPLVADYNRYAARPRGAFFGTFIGYLVANVWLYGLGALLVLEAGAEPSPAGIATGILAIAGGTVAGLSFLAGLLVGETDEAFANIYSGAVALQNVFPSIPRRPASIGIAATGTLLAAYFTMDRYESFLFLLGSVFVPLFGVLAADYFFHGRRHIAVDELYGRRGRYWFSSGVRLTALIPWLAGIVVYHWVLPTGPSWWVGAIESLGTPLAERLPFLSASLPSFAVAFLIALALPRLSFGPRR